MNDLMMLEHLLKKTGRKYDKLEDTCKIVIQVYCFDGRVEFDFDLDGNLEEDWDNSSVSTWLSGGYYYD